MMDIAGYLKQVRAACDSGDATEQRKRYEAVNPSLIYTNGVNLDLVGEVEQGTRREFVQ